MRLSNQFLRFDRVVTVISLLFFAAIAVSAGEEAENGSDRLLGRWAHRERLESSGVSPFAELTTEAWGNVAGGLQKGAWWNQLLNFGVELDSEKLGAWAGGKFLAQMHWVANSQRNSTFADYTGGVNPVSGIMASDQVRVFNLYYEQRWGDKVALKVGQIAVDDDFMLSDYTGFFANSAFGAMPSQVGNRLASCCGFSPAFPIYSVAAPGLFLRVQPSESLYFQGGLYNGRPGQDTPDNHGFGWASESHWEAAMFFEGGYHYELGDRDAILRLGVSHHTGKLESFSAANDAGGETMQAVPNFYAVHDLELLHSTAGEPILGLFSRAGLTPNGNRSMVAAYADAGLNWFAPIPGREDDVAGIAVSYTRFGQDFQKSTGPNGVATDQTAVELAYKAQLTRCFSVQGDVQFLLNPAANPETGSRETGVVVGVRGRLTF